MRSYRVESDVCNTSLTVTDHGGSPVYVVIDVADCTEETRLHLTIENALTLAAALMYFANKAGT